MRVYAFDFDGTLTKKDTFIEFIEYVKGYGKTFWGFFLFSPILILMKLKLYPNWKAKQQVFAWFFKGMPIDEFDDYCQKFARNRQKIIRPGGLEVIRKAIAEGDNVVVITASIENWVRPFFKEFGDAVQTEGTQIAVRHDTITGDFLTKNCYGEEKLKRLLQVFPYRHSYQLIAFGDSNGDRHLLSEADEAHFQPFRSKRRVQMGEIVRFGMVGILATAIQYGIYLLFLRWAEPRISNTIGYAVSFVFNYFASTYFTFRVKSTARRGAGFAFSHLVNYLLQTGTLSLFLLMGLQKEYAMIPVFGICVPINFLLVRTFLKKK